MKLIAPVFHPRARTSPAIEAAAATVMLACARAEGHQPGREGRMLRPRPLSERDQANIRLAREKLKRGMIVNAAARELGLSPKHLRYLLGKAGIGRDGSEVRR